MMAWIFAIILSGSAFGASDSIRVRLSKGLQSVELQGNDLQLWVDQMRFAPALNAQMSRLQIERGQIRGETGWRVRWNSQPHFVFHKGHDLEVRGSLLKMGRLSLPGRVHFVIKKDRHRFDLISHLELERYVLGVLPSEMPLSWPLEALRAQAVAARSFALALKEERVDKDFDLESSIMDQVFEYSPEAMKTVKWSDKAQRAVSSTAGLVLREKGAFVRAYYHADCGGKTESSVRVWGGNSPHNPELDVRRCEHESRVRWNFAISKTELQQRAKDSLKGKIHGGIKSVKPQSPNSSERIESLSLIFNDGFIWKITAQDFRRLVGFSEIKSTHFSVEEWGEELRFVGQGNGHGVGMCQFGAREMAHQGKTMQDILKFYFPKSGLEPVGATKGKVLAELSDF